jgi:hypothetical protein
VDEAYLGNHRRGKDEGIAVWQPQAAGEVIEYICERKPVVDQALEGTQAAALGGTLEGWLIRTQGLECQATGRGGFQGIGHM